ncbi:MAG: large conductance mechanosensitive channel protein MscL [Polyangiaceae bacterium]|nr:large conductance mechanosensitive channel protein MscL [Polyangiaceae bacterium]
MSMMKEFKEFAFKGNLIDMAVGVVVGGVFGKLSGSFVEDLVNPFIGLLMGKVDFTNTFVLLKEGEKVKAPYLTVQAAKDAGATVMTYGNFINHVVNFFITAFVIFLVVKAVNKFRAAAPPAGPTETEKLLAEIRDALKK